MVKLVYNGSYLNKYTYDRIRDVKTNLRNAYNILEYLDIPNDFKYKTYLKGCDNELKRYYDRLDKLYNWLQKTNNQLNDCIDDLENDINKIEVTVIKSRNN